ncbi:glycerate kinase [Candidatus Enterococcus courvalinii]|uniref:Glycerate kinase n=1 Tax=Candidatus Enterococcus courvalinii TaxID=2815329 RepID=A0ABS3HYN7_9ENTE|nr:glycerate kinase [Enterococcus sp. MSG2901]
MKVLVAIDSFKGSARSVELNRAVAKKLNQLDFVESTAEIAIADGGEGTLTSVQNSLNGTVLEIPTIDLMGNPINAKVLSFRADGKRQALIESADTMGLDLIKPNAETVRTASSKGLGLLIKEIERRGFEKVIITLGGSGVTDGGLGLLKEYGAAFVDAQQNNLEEGNLLLDAREIELSTIKFPEIPIVVANDVTNPYFGEHGAFQVFSQQKGATVEQIQQLDANAKNLSQVIFKELKIDLATTEGAGAAGGLGGALAILGAKMEPGFKLITELINFEERLKTVDVVVTGEGSIDQQSLFGKVPFAIAELAARYQKPVIAICGKKSITNHESSPFSGIFSIQTRPISLTDAMEKETTLTNAAELVSSIFITAFQLSKNGGIEHGSK